MPQPRFPAVFGFALCFGALSANAACNQVSIPNPVESRDYFHSISQQNPSEKASAIEHFLLMYPHSHAKESILESLVNTYDLSRMKGPAMEAAARLLQVNPDNLRGLYVTVRLELAARDKGSLADAAAKARKGINAPKPVCMSDSDYQIERATADPFFRKAIETSPISPRQ